VKVLVTSFKGNGKGARGIGHASPQLERGNESTENSQWFQRLDDIWPSSSSLCFDINKQVQRLATICIKDSIVGLRCQEC
jgi:hypothetical protein